jgi:hypothetical protein
VNTHLWVANCRFRNFELHYCHWAVQMVFEAEVTSVLMVAVCVCWRRCTGSCLPPVCLQSLCGTMLARQESVHVACTKHSQVTFHHCLHNFRHRNLNTQLPLLSDFGAWFPDHVLHFLSCGVPKPYFRHFGYIQTWCI